MEKISVKDLEAMEKERKNLIRENENIKKSRSSAYDAMDMIKIAFDEHIQRARQERENLLMIASGNQLLPVMTGNNNNATSSSAQHHQIEITVLKNIINALSEQMLDKEMALSHMRSAAMMLAREKTELTEKLQQYEANAEGEENNSTGSGRERQEKRKEESTNNNGSTSVSSTATTANNPAKNTANS